MTPDDKLKDEILHQTLSLFRVGADKVAMTTKRLKALEKKLIEQLNAPLTSQVTKDEINNLLANTDKIIKDYYGGIQQELDFGDLAQTVSQRTVSSLEFALGAKALELPISDYFASVASNVLIQGSPAADWWQAQSDKTAFKFAQQVRQGLSNGETNQQIIGRIVGTRTTTGVMDIARRDAASLVQTSVQAVANDARLTTFRKNSDVITGVKQISTLDSHTSLICIGYSGSTWDLDGNPIRGTKLAFNGGPPRHFNCRSVLVPITKTFAELGLKNVDEPGIKNSTRASDQGPISNKTEFDQFLKRKGNAYVDEMLGKGRADLWRAGKITTKDLVNGQGRPLTTEELKAKFDLPFSADGFRRKFDDPSVTPLSILEKFPLTTSGKIADVEARIKLAGTTEQRFSIDGVYSAERINTAHRKIFDELLSPEAMDAATPIDGKPTFTVLGGRGGSGKTLFDGEKFKQVGVYDKAKTIVINSDTVKEMLPEYAGWNAAELHDEASHLVKQLLAEARAANLNVVLDGTMQKEINISARMNEFKKEGYAVNAYYMHLPRQESATRAVKRFLDGEAEKQGKGRYVPIEVLLGNTTNEATFDTILAKADDWAFFDNNVPKGFPPNLIARKN